MIITSVDKEATVTGSSTYGDAEVLDTNSASSNELLYAILVALNKIEHHMSELTDTDLAQFE